MCNSQHGSYDYSFNVLAFGDGCHWRLGAFAIASGTFFKDDYGEAHVQDAKDLSRS